MRYLEVLFVCFLSISFARAQEINSSLVSGLKFRSVGPALTSGRVADIAVDPTDHSVWYVAAASGGVWKTENNGTTFQPIFDGQGSYSIGCVTIDPNNHHRIWVGTGENNNQRSVAYGDGVYMSEDGGKSWKHMGLNNSEHIGMIAVDPTNSQTVYVAAYGPLWSAGGERGLYKSTDGGDNWEKILFISEHTGINEVHLDPRNPNVIYATAHQRRRHVFTYLGGGPESAIYKSEDGGKSFKKLGGGLPSGVDVGRIGMDISPVNPDRLFAIMEAQYGKEGLYRSDNRGASWKKVNSFTTSGNYYQEVICDPHDADKLYLMDTYGRFSEDAGEHIQRIPAKNKHVDDHCIWIDPQDPNHWIMGCDGGLYESWDHAENWFFKANLPITQFYKVSVDQAQPFYNIYGGTQDNFSLGGPSQTLSENGILNEDWYVTNGGDGFETQIDPENPDIVYAQAQYGWIVRYDKKSGEKIFIQPQPRADEAPFRWNWDAPLLISPHDNKTLYFAANKLFKSIDRGNSWDRVSPDLTRQIDRNKLKVMDKVWSVDAIMKNKSTTIYGNIVALDESPLKKGLLYVGTDDGLIQVSANGGESWNKIEKVKGVPARTYVNMLWASRHKENRVYAVFNNHKMGDFKPYVYLSEDNGKSWENISANLPVRGSVYSIAEDHEDENLLFVGTEFGVFFTLDRGQNWHQLKAGLPTIAVRDIAIQEKENDLVLGTFGRGFYVLDDYSPLRHLKADKLEKEFDFFPSQDALMYVQRNDLGRGRLGFQGDALYSADNPEYGAVISWYLKESPKSLKDIRKEKEKNAEEVTYPDLEELKKEDREEDAYLLFVISDNNGNEVRRMKAAPQKGIHRLYWDFKHNAQTSPKGDKSVSGRWALPGTYTVKAYISENGLLRELEGSTDLICVPLNNNTLTAADKKAVAEFSEKLGKLRKVVDASNSYLNELNNRKDAIERVLKYHDFDVDLLNELREIDHLIADTRELLNGDPTRTSRDFEAENGINWRIGMISGYLYNTTAAHTESFETSYQVAYSMCKDVLVKMGEINSKLGTIEQTLNDANAPYTPGRLPKLD